MPTLSLLTSPRLPCCMAVQRLKPPANPWKLLLHLLKKKKLCKKPIFVMLVFFAKSPFMSHHTKVTCAQTCWEHDNFKPTPQTQHSIDSGCLVALVVRLLCMRVLRCTVTQLLNKLMIKLHVNMAVAQYRASSAMLIQQQDLGGGLFSRPASSRGVACS